MSTHSMIGMERKDGKVKAIYCHFDGYLEGGVGQCLFFNYRDREKIEKLLDLGDISALGKEPISSPDLWEGFAEPNYEMTRAYKDRGEDCPARIMDKKEFFSSMEYNYLYTSDNKWICNKNVDLDEYFSKNA